MVSKTTCLIGYTNTVGLKCLEINNRYDLNIKIISITTQFYSFSSWPFIQTKYSKQMLTLRLYTLMTLSAVFTKKLSVRRANSIP